MLEKPTIDEQAMITVLRQQYDLVDAALAFLPIGNETNTWVYDVQSPRGRFFLKVKKGLIYEPSVRVPQYLHDHGLPEVVAPIPGSTQAPSVVWNDYALILYPWVDGKAGSDQALSREQWQALGAIVRRMHAVTLSEPLLANMRRATFSTTNLPAIRRIEERLLDEKFSDAYQSAFAVAWKRHAEEIAEIVRRYEALAATVARAPSAPFVVCYGDLQTTNVIVTPEGGLRIVDWDHVALGPKEGDLMFIVGKSDAEQHFFAGYGAVTLRNDILAFNYYGWCALELADYGERLLFGDFGDAVKKDALSSFEELFSLGNILDAARRNDI